MSAGISAYLVWEDSSWQQIISALTAFVAAVGYYLTSPVFSKSAIVDLDADGVATRRCEIPPELIRDGDLSMRLEITLRNRGDCLHDIDLSSPSRFAVSLERYETHDAAARVSFLDQGESADLVVRPVRSDHSVVPVVLKFRNKDGAEKLKGRVYLKEQRIEWL